jgi:hypothetical protein
MARLFASLILLFGLSACEIINMVPKLGTFTDRGKTEPPPTTTAKPSRLALQPANPSGYVGAEVTLSVSLLDEHDQPFAATADTVVSLAVTGHAGLYRTVVNGTINAITIPKGQSQAAFKAIDTVVEAATVTASATGLAAVSRQVTFTDAPFRATLKSATAKERSGSCFSLELALVDTGGAPLTLATDVVFTLSAPQYGAFSLGAGCTGSIQKATVPAGQTKVALSYRSTGSGSQALLAQSGVVTAPATVVVCANKLSLTPATATTFAGQEKVLTVVAAGGAGQAHAQSRQPVPANSIRMSARRSRRFRSPRARANNRFASTIRKPSKPSYRRARPVTARPAT